MTRTPERRAWWLCPNDPRCGHGRVLHDGDGHDEPYTCCVEGCTCVTPPEPDPDEHDDLDEHDRAHRWYHAGCADCDLRADWLEAGRP